MTVERTPPEMMSARERAAEITTLLAQAILRLHAAQPASTADPAEPPVRLGLSAQQRVHTNPLSTGVQR